ncbi:MAG: site-specific DNA-methyltransferase [Treponema sp.]|nr:site-specific DNA-methyltransferase [Treponema sp.]
MITLTWNDVPETYDDISQVNSLKFTPELSSTSDNHIFISADNYPALQKLLPIYENKINLIYIDPPYNTGNNFAYDDNQNHDSWLSFMSRRLGLAQKLLAPTGCIFIAIDQTELYHLKLLCDKIFGEKNFVNDFMWLHGKGKKDTWSRTLQQHTLCYAKDKTQLPPFRETQSTNWATKNADNDPRGNWFSGSVSFSEKRSNPNHKNYFTIKSPSGVEWTRQWQRTKEEMDALLADNRIYFGPAPGYNAVPRIKIFNQDTQEIIPRNIIDEVESTRHAQGHLDELLGEKNSFDNPKPVDLIEHLITIACPKKDALVMDFFAGSGTTFEAVCRLNKKDGGTRHTILIQKPEPNKNQSSYKTISDLCWARVQKNSEQYNQACIKLDVIAGR